MKPCAEFSEELATCAANGPALSPKASAHLEHCRDCQAAFAEFESVAMVHTQAAANLPIPMRRANLEAWKLEPSQKQGGEPRLFSLPGWRLYLGAALIAVLLTGALFVSRTVRDVPRSNQTVELNPEKDPQPAASPHPTWQAYRQELRTSPEDLAAPSIPRAGALVVHYRLKDAHFGVN